MSENKSGFERAGRLFQLLLNNLQTVICGQERMLQWLLAAMGAGGHVLLEDVPGTGKTTLAKALACSCLADFQRIQFTPDLVPSDILGISIFDQQEQTFRFEKGPVFCHILLADEINRASPRTQSALLEAMAEFQVSIERRKRVLPSPFFVIATQNPVEYHGTYPLPEAQLDRFAMRFGLGYVSADKEVEIMSAQGEAHPLETLKPCIKLEELIFLQQQVRQVRISPELQRYIVSIVSATRETDATRLGASPRASLTLMMCAQALSLIDGFDYVTPDSIRELAVPVIAHRLSVDAHSRFSGVQVERIVQDIVANCPVPA